MIIGILQPSYLPWIGCFEQIIKSDVFVIYDDVQYEKGSWRNRNKIKTPHGEQWLTVPVLAKGLGNQLIKVIQINNSVSWQKKHLNGMQMNYAKSSFFKEYFPEIAGILNNNYDLLIDLDLALINWICDKLKIKTEFILASQLGIEGSNQERLIEIVKELGGDCFYEGAAGKNYITPSLFEQQGIRVEFQDYSHPEYEQLFGPFISHLSVIDLLFNHGTESKKIIMKGKV
jgi:hypothetical protein